MIRLLFAAIYAVVTLSFVFIIVASLGAVLMVMAYPIGVLDCKSKTSGMNIKNYEYRLLSAACVVQTTDGYWIPLENYRETTNKRDNN